MNKTALFKATVYSLVLAYFGLSQLSAQSSGSGVQLAANPDVLQMEVDYGQGKTKKRSSQQGVMGPVGLPLDQTAVITLRFPGNRAGESVAIGAPDGGEITGTAGNILLSAIGTIVFTFRVNGTPGLYRALIELPSESHVLSFYAFAPRATP